MSTLTQFFGSGGGASAGIPCELLVVGGGGGGAAFTNATYGGSGGGGGSGRVIFTRYTLPFSTAAVITVGAGGASNASSGTRSSFDDILSAGGGGCGGGLSDFSFNGGSGGGFNAHSAGYVTGPGSCTDTFNTPNFISAASAAAPQLGVYSNRSGGGAGGPGAGLQLSITGSSVTYAAGGAGGNPYGASTLQNGAANTGTGGNGSNAANTTGSGGSGVVIIAYPDTYSIPAAISGTYNEPTRSGYRVYRFTGSGSITLPAS